MDHMAGNVVFLILVSTAVHGCEDYHIWELRTPSLYCPDTCNANAPRSYERNTCCSCNSVPEWKCNSSITIGNLQVEYVSKFGNGIIAKNDKESYVFYILTHKNGVLSEIPENICDFPRIVKIDLSNNAITHIRNISCLRYLDELNLSYNKITSVHNKNFEGITSLRVLDLSHNDMLWLGPGTLNSTGGGMMYMYLQHNSLDGTDVSNIILDTPFCKSDLSGNKLTHFTNDHGWKVNTSVEYPSGGFVDLTDNLFTDFFDIINLGFDDLKKFGKLFSFDFDVRNGTWDCNCKWVKFLQLAKEVIPKISQKYLNVVCSLPENLKGQRIVDLVDSLDLFVCELDKPYICQTHCKCIEQTNQNRTIIDCSNSSLQRMPRFLPVKPNLHISFQNNNIKEIENLTYLSHASYVDFRNNSITRIPEFLAFSLPNAYIALQNNPINDDFPTNIVRLHPCNINFGSPVINCSCHTFWIKEWLESRSQNVCDHIHLLTCKLSDKISKPTLLMRITREDFECGDENSDVVKIIALNLSTVLAIICISAIVSKFYRCEIILLWRNFRQKSMKTNRNLPFHAYISLSEANVELLTWVSNIFLPSLENTGYRLFLPCRDLEPGGTREEDTLISMGMCQNFIVFVSADYFDCDDPWPEMEWRYIWTLYRRNRDTKLILINFDQLRVRNVQSRVAKAFFRLRLYLDFANRKHELLQNVKNILGKVKQVSMRTGRNTTPKYMVSCYNDERQTYPIELGKPYYFLQNHVYYVGDTYTTMENILPYCEDHVVRRNYFIF